MSDVDLKGEMVLQEQSPLDDDDDDDMSMD